MNKKALRKELELNLIKGMEDVLNNHNHKASKKIRKITYQASKTVAKKFVKALKTISGNEIPIPKADTIKPAIKKQAVVEAKIQEPASKKKVVPLKTKVKK
jgi:hypothetical protein